MITLDELRKFRKFIEQMAVNATDKEALENIEAFPKWKVDTDYTAQKDRVRYEGLLYRCEQSHKSQSDYTPDVAHSLWTRIDDPSIEWPDWRQPTGSTDKYSFGAKVSHLVDEHGNKRHWISNVPDNVWEPGVYGWDEL